jgi:hypothetical protein
MAAQKFRVIFTQSAWNDLEEIVAYLARESLEKLLSWDFDKLIIAHGICIEKDAKPFVERAFQWFKP